MDDSVMIFSPTDVRYESAIGCDVHRDSIVCYSLAKAESGQWVQTKGVFKTTNDSLRDFVNWCNSHNPQKILMESTGIYWMPAYNSLEAANLPIALVNPCHVKRMDGKKTDMEDACWLAKVAVNGTFTASYIPSIEYRNLRFECRNVTKMVDTLTSYKNRETKLFASAGYKLSIFSDQFGASAMIAKQAILDGKSPAEVTAIVRAHGSKKVKATRKEMLEAFSGNMTETIRRTILCLRKIYNELERQIAEEKKFLIDTVKALEGPAALLLKTIPGISDWTATVVLIEIGGVVNFLRAFANCDRFAAWTALCPSNNQSANKKTGSKRRKGNKYLRRALCESAQAASRTKDTTFRSKYQSLVIRLGTKKSIVAIAHKIANMIYYVISNNAPYVDPHIDYQQKSCEKNAARWCKQMALIEGMEFTLTNTKTGEVITSQSLRDKNKSIS